MSWRSRASSMGRHVTCDFSALLDRAIDEGLIEIPAEERATLKAGNQYTDFGTVCHFVLMDGTGGVFPGPVEDFKPTQDEIEQAAGMTGGSVDAMWAKAREVATLAATHLPKAPDGKPWLCETPFGKDPACSWPFSGTIDFLSQDYSEIGDLKTTSRPPEGKRIKTTYLIQLVCYAWLVKQQTGVMPKTGWILYVSSKADWVIPPIRVNYEALGDYTDMIIAQAMRFTGPIDQLQATCAPRLLDDKCGELYCPHTSRCRDVLRPPAGQQLDGRPTITSSVRSTPLFKVA